MSVDCLKPVYFKCLAPTPSSPPTTTVVSLSSSPPTPICTTCSGRHVRFLKDLTYNNMKYSFMFSLYSFSHALFHTCYVHSYTHSLFNHSFLISFIQAFFCLLFIFVCLFCLPPFWGGGVLWYAMCFDACAVDSTSLCNIIFIFTSLVFSPGILVYLSPFLVYL